MVVLVVGGVQEDEALELTVAFEYVYATVAAIGDVHVALTVDLHVVGIIEGAGVLIRMRSAHAVTSPGGNPVAPRVHLGDARVDIAIADVDVAFRVPSHVGR